jgi:hypothetical protein
MSYRAYPVKRKPPRAKAQTLRGEEKLSIMNKAVNFITLIYLFK